ncbi:hypothetical protein D3C87_1850810 [compost metagenome]
MAGRRPGSAFVLLPSQGWNGEDTFIDGKGEAQAQSSQLISDLILGINLADDKEIQ